MIKMTQQKFESLQRKLAWGLSLVLVAGLAACGTRSVNPVTGETERTVMDERTELAEGQKAHQQVLQSYGELKVPRLQSYVSEVGMRMAKLSERPQLPWTFTVLDSPEVNAFALPGGYVYVTRGIMAYMQSEADLAGVLGHEIGHVTARHGAQRATRAQNAGVGVMLATVLGVVAESAGVSGAAQAANQLSQGVAAGYVAKYSREQESQADRLGAAYLQKINHDPRNMVDVINVLKHQEQFAVDRARAEGRQMASGQDYLASHPANEQRLKDITTVAQQYQGRYQDEGRQRHLRAMDGVTFGESREQGVTRGRHFFHEPLGFGLTAPAGWKIDNDADSLSLLAPDGTAGLIVRTLPPKAGTSHEEIIKNAIKPVSGRSELRTLNGMRATHFVGITRNAQGQPQPIETTIVTGPNQTNFAFIYAAKDSSAMSRHRAGLVEAEASFRGLSGAERSAAQPWTLRLTPYPRGGFAELARSSPLPQAEAQLRLINGYYGGGEPKVGDVVKVAQ
jgi:predicted Zn-dependent protease